MAINIQEILHPSDSDSIKFEKINYNFDQILANGGGPVGPKGQKGDQGQVGSTGQKGQKGEIGATGSKGDSGATDSPWYKVELDSNNDGTSEVTILKPKIGSDLNMPVIWLGDSSFEEDIDDGILTSNARLTISKDDVYENYLNLWHASDKSIVLTSSVDSGFTKFNFQNSFGSSNLEFGVTTNKISFLANTSTFSAIGAGVLLKSLNNTNVKIETAGEGILDVDINAEFKGYLRLPSGDTGARPITPQVGMIRFNTDLDAAEVYYANSGSPEWRELCTDCGSAIVASIGILGGNIEAKADGSPLNETINIGGGNINAASDGSPINGTQPTATPIPTAQPTATPAPTATPIDSGSGSGSGSGGGAGPTATPVPTAQPTGTPVPTAQPTPVGYFNNVYTIQPQSSSTETRNSSFNLYLVSNVNWRLESTGTVYLDNSLTGTPQTIADEFEINIDVNSGGTIKLIDNSTNVVLSTYTVNITPTPTETPGGGSGSGTPTITINSAVEWGNDSTRVSFSKSTLLCNSINAQHSTTPTGPWVSATSGCTSPITLNTQQCGTTKYFRLVLNTGSQSVLSNVFEFEYSGCGGGSQSS